MGEINRYPTQPPDLGQSVLEVLRGPLYQKAREAIIHYETIERERATSAIIELRDALDHMWHAAQSNDPAEIHTRIQAMVDHLRRAAVEPAQEMVESRLHRIFHNLQRYQLRRLIYGGLPSRERVDEELEEVERLLELGRNQKARVEHLDTTLDYFERAHVAATNLNTKLEGRRVNAAVRIGVYLFPVAVGIAGLVLAVLALAAD